jgi:hypothetical protein
VQQSASLPSITTAGTERIPNPLAHCATSARFMSRMLTSHDGQATWLTSSIVSAHVGHPALNTSISRFIVMILSPSEELKKRLMKNQKHMPDIRRLCYGRARRSRLTPRPVRQCHHTSRHWSRKQTFLLERRRPPPAPAQRDRIPGASAHGMPAHRQPGGETPPSAGTDRYLRSKC